MYQVLSIYLNEEIELGSVAKKLIYILCLFAFTGSVYAQSLEPILTLSKDSVMLGEEFDVNVTISYPKKRQILFSDSTHFFGTFELVKKAYSTTTTNDSISVDSAVYTFITFDLSSPQKLAIPIFIVTANDSIEIVSDSVPVYIKEVIEDLPDEINIKGNTTYQEVDYEFNKNPWYIGIGLSIYTIIALIILLGRRALNYFKTRRLKKDQDLFNIKMNQLCALPSLDEVQAEELIVLWKNHLSKLTGAPYHSLSTTEIYEHTKNLQLKTDLREFDKAIYSKEKLYTANETVKSLLQFVDVKYDLKIKQLGNGR